MSGSSYSEDVFNIYTVFPLVWVLFPGEANDHYLWQKYKEDFVWFSLTHCSGGCWARLIGWNWVSPCCRAGGGSSLLESHEVGKFSSTRESGGDKFNTCPLRSLIVTICMPFFWSNWNSGNYSIVYSMFWPSFQYLEMWSLGEHNWA